MKNFIQDKFNQCLFYAAFSGFLVATLAGCSQGNEDSYVPENNQAFEVVYNDLANDWIVTGIAGGLNEQEVKFGLCTMPQADAYDIAIEETARLYDFDLEAFKEYSTERFESNC